MGHGDSSVITSLAVAVVVRWQDREGGHHVRVERSGGKFPLDVHNRNLVIPGYQNLHTQYFRTC